ncbi:MULTISPECIES: 2-isopropylmalate synthase [unclassified Streptomyces]|uniref:2-isopropylmalate synthase n=1 Tax=unclassified Streptomyces TaxID=2593676 RepID=UPI0033EDCC4C
MVNDSVWEGDAVRASVKAGKLVVFEESARDGAQGKTLMDAETRIALARAHGRMFGADGHRHVMFAAGFPSACREEFEITRRVAQEVEEISATCVCRGTPRDIDTAIAAMRGAPHGRLMYFLPGSEAVSQALLKKSAKESVDQAVEMARYAVERADGLAIDMAFSHAPQADRELLIDAVSRLTEAGVASVQLADTVGGILPHEAHELYTDVTRRADPQAVVMAHLHNDLGMALANTVQAVRAGIRIVASSWLGLGERSGMACTEQLMFLLSYAPERLPGLIGTSESLWWTDPDLRRVPELTRLVSQATGTPLKVTDPLVGSGVGTISTGTPFVDRSLFQPYDPTDLLGIEPTVVLTQLASDRVVRAAAENLNLDLDADQVRAATQWVKSEAFRQGDAVVADEKFRLFAEGLLARNS